MIHDCKGETRMKKVGFIGLGVMGKPMAINLVRAGYDVLVYDLVEEPVKELIELGAERAETKRQLVENCELVITMLPNSSHVKAVMIEDEDAIIKHVKPGIIIVDMSSISPSVTKEIYTAFKKQNVSYIDAPVSGGRIGAESGSLSIMVGGEEERFNQVRDVLKVLGSKIMYMGKSGAGQTTKICNQIVVAGTVTVLSEAMVVAQREGLDLYKLRDVLMFGGANCWHLEHKAIGMIEEDYSPQFKAELLLKDIHLAVDQAEHNGLNLTILQQIKHLFEQLVTERGGEFDYTAIFDLINKSSDSMHDIQN